MKLTIDEKLRLLSGKNGWQTEDLDGKLQSVVLSDGPLGVRKTSQSTWDGNSFMAKDLPAVAYPSAEVLSQTWDPELAYEMGACLADDCIEKDVDVLLGPGVNIKRSPVCGRNFEYFSEDPYVAGVFGREYIRGLQSGHVGATLKHYLANNNEFGRLWSSSNADERTLREIYMRAFELALQAQPWAVMTSYNLLNGVRVSNNKEYVDILRQELGHGENLIMSDWDAVKDHPASVSSGHDLEMPFNQNNLEALRSAYAEGRVTEAAIDSCVQRVLGLVEKVSAAREARKITHTTEQRRQTAQKIQEEGIVLLKNNGVLPIRSGQSVALTAQVMDRYIAGGGSACVVPEQEQAPLLGCLKELLPDSTIDSDQIWGGDYVKCFTNADGKDVSIVTVGFPMSEGNDRRSLTLKNWDNEDWFIKALAKRNPNTVVVVTGGGVFDMSEWIDDVAAVVYVGYPGQMGNPALARVLTGAVNPSGKLTETFAVHQSDYPSESIFFDGLNYNYNEGMEVGYRHFDKHPEKVRYPFGYGLSYTSFAYSGLQVEQGGKAVTFTLANTGDRDGAEVSQLYVRPMDSKIDKPLKELRGFAKTFLKAGEAKTVHIQLDSRAFDHYDVNTHAWVTDPGSYELIVAENAQAERLCAKINITGLPLAPEQHQGE